MNKNKKLVLFKPRKDLGQNFIFDEFFLKKIVDTFKFSESTKKIIEVGPGYGNLTFLIQKKFSNRKLICIEKDFDLFKFTKTKFSNFENVEIFFGDSLDFKWEVFLSKNLENEKLEYKVEKENGKFGIVGNLPYNISNDLIFSIVQKIDLFDNIFFLIQKEVAQKWVATPTKNKKNYSYYSVLIDYFFEERNIEFEIPRKIFKPIPEVDGALISLKKRKKLFFDSKKEEKKFLAFVKNCFKFRRKTFLNNIKNFSDENIFFKAEKTLEMLNYNSKARPQELWLKDYFEIYKSFN